MFRFLFVVEPHTFCMLFHSKYFRHGFFPIYLFRTHGRSGNVMRRKYRWIDKGVDMIRAEIGLKNRQIINETYSFRCFLIL